MSKNSNSSDLSRRAALVGTGLIVGSAGINLGKPSVASAANKTPQGTQAAARMAALLDRFECIEKITSAYIFSEVREWDRFIMCYTDPVTFDYAGGKPGTQSRDDLLAWCKRSIGVFDKTQHQVTNSQVDIDGDTAKARSWMRATHVIGAHAWIVGGMYTHRLVRSQSGDWLITSQRFRSFYSHFADVPGDGAAFNKARAERQATIDTHGDYYIPESRD